MKVGELGEDQIVATLIEGLASSQQVLVGPGDDCAVIEAPEGLILLKTDAVVEGIHFLSEENPKRVGWKAVARVLSDFAAMGGVPKELLVTLAISKSSSVAWVKELYEGMASCLKKHGGVIVGGETTSIPDGSPAMISIAGKGQVQREHLVTRSGGVVGDGIYVTGHLGGSLAGHHLDFNPRIEQAAWLVENVKPSAMMDLSDGLAKDLPRLAKMSGCGFQLQLDALPCREGCSLENALGDGEDYELLFTSESHSELIKSWQRVFPEVRLTKIGELVLEEGQSISGGWDHFRAEDSSLE
jgi:thiamine-monophosphate kinase